MYEDIRARLGTDREKYAKFEAAKHIHAAIVELHNADIRLRDPIVLAKRLASGETLEPRDLQRLAHELGQSG